MTEDKLGGAFCGSCPLSVLGGIMYGWCPFRPRHGGRPVADHLLQVMLFAFALPLLAQDAGDGDGFTSSDRTMLQEIHTRSAAIKNDTTTIRQDVTAIRNDVGDISDAVDDLLDYASSHSDSLHNIYQDTQHIRTFVDDIVADINGIYGNSTYLPTIHTDLVSVRQQLQYLRGDISDIPDQVTQINGHLLNIDRETTESSDYLQSIDYYVKYLATLVEGISTNSPASVDISVISNVLSQISAPVDLSIVTNFLAAQSFPFFTATFFPDFGARYGELMRDMFGYDSDYEFTADDYATVFGSSQMGFFMSMLVQALFPSPDDIFDSIATTTPNLFAYAWENFGNGGQDYNTSLWVDWPYTIFEAYNTLGLAVLTNQANTLISQGVYVTNSLAAILTNLVASLSVAEKTKDALYYPEDSETIYETTNHYSIPEWEPTYHAGIADNTNHYYYFQQADSFTRSLIGNYTSLLGRVIGGIKPQHRDWDAKITWSGWPSMQGQYGGWDLDVKLPETPDVVDFAKYIKFLSRLVCFVLDLLIVLLGATRIHKTVMGGKLPFES